MKVFHRKHSGFIGVFGLWKTSPVSPLESVSEVYIMKAIGIKPT
jgi:hypothetical protein